MLNVFFPLLPGTVHVCVLHWFSGIRSSLFAAEGNKDDGDLKQSRKEIKINKRRYAFIFGVYFFAGFYLGEFGARSAIAAHLGIPVTFKDCIWNVPIDLILCCAVEWWHVVGKEDALSSVENDSSSNEEEEQEIESGYDSDDDGGEEETASSQC